MTLQTTRWSPDTCGCVLEYTWDDAVPEVLRVHTPARVVTVCSVHQALAGLSNRFGAVSQENTRKNQAHELLQTLLTKLDPSEFTFDVTGPAGSRVVTITIIGKNLTAQQKANLQTQIDTRFTPGKVVLAYV